MCKAFAKIAVVIFPCPYLLVRAPGRWGLLSKCPKWPLAAQLVDAAPKAGKRISMRQGKMVRNGTLQKSSWGLVILLSCSMKG